MHRAIISFSPLFLIVVALAMVSQSRSQQLEPVLDAGTLVPIRLVSSIDASRASVGDLVHFEVESAISKAGTVVVPKGAAVLGEVVAVRRRGIIGRGASVTLAAEEVELPDGRTVPLRAARTTAKGRRTAALLTTGALAGLIVSVAAAPVALLIPGPDSVVPAGTELLARVGAIERADADRGSGVASASARITPGAATQTAMNTGAPTPVRIVSLPNGAVVSDNGVVLGVTPLATSISRGSHVLSVAARGFATVNRVVLAGPQRLSLKFVLEPGAGEDPVLEALLSSGRGL